MRKILMAVIMAAMVAGCEKSIVPDGDTDAGSETAADYAAKKFTFTVKGDFGAATFSEGATRTGYLNADGQDMTDLWVFDFVDGVCVNSVHQQQSTAGDAWGKPTMALGYGSHHVYFVASRGDTPVIDETGKTIVWDVVKDTFWKDYAVTVTNTSNGNRAVTLDRVATKLRITVNDQVPTGCASVTVTPATWYYGINYTTGDAVSAQTKDRTITVPAAYVGTSGQLVVNIYGVSKSDEWTTNVAVNAKDGDGNVIGSASISGAPFKRNRATEYSGSLFASNGGIDVNLAGGWEQSVSGSW